jgi:hypothetical protein
MAILGIELRALHSQAFYHLVTTPLLLVLVCFQIGSYFLLGPGLRL